MSLSREQLAARAQALFTSPLSASLEYTADEVTDAILNAVGAHRDFHGCAVAAAGEYGAHPEVAVIRMRWAIEAVTLAYGAASNGDRPPATTRRDSHDVELVATTPKVPVAH